VLLAELLLDAAALRSVLASGGAFGGGSGRVIPSRRSAQRRVRPHDPALLRTQTKKGRPLTLTGGDSRPLRVARVSTDRLFELASHLIERDRELVLCLYDQQLLTTEQLQLLFFSSRRRAQDRLLFLYCQWPNQLLLSEGKGQQPSSGHPRRERLGHSRGRSQDAGTPGVRQQKTSSRGRMSSRCRMIGSSKSSDSAWAPNRRLLNGLSSGPS
jgi:hypothetical protein